ncbi:serpin [Bacteroidia bacterium]|nr:serpin [Bacteroidia bacterium]
MKKTILLLSVWATLFLFSCGSSAIEENNTTNPPIKINLSETEAQIQNERSAFAANLFSTINKEEPEKENIVISPLSLNMALAMVWNGAKGETQEAIQNAMGMGDYPSSEVNNYFKKLRETFLKTDPLVQLSIANSIWTRKGFPVKPSFYDTNKNYYNAETRELDFSNANAPKTINQWCSDNTDDRIKKIIEGEIPSAMVMYLINALYFKGEWSKDHGFVASETKAEPFYKENGQQIKVNMMQQKNTSGYYSDEYLASTALPYGNGAFSMVFILPNESVALNDVLEQLKQADYWARCMNPSGSSEVNLYIPKFKIEYERTMNETLKRLGMGIAFTESADFSGIANNLAISAVKQKTFIDVNEKGSEAAAVTAIGIMATSISIPRVFDFRANRPFLFAIKENLTGTVLFMGKIGCPEYSGK